MEQDQTVRFPDGSTKTYPRGMHPQDFQDDVRREYERRQIKPPAETPFGGYNPAMMNRMDSTNPQNNNAIMRTPPNERELMGNTIALSAGLMPGAGVPAFLGRLAGTMTGGAIRSGTSGAAEEGIMETLGTVLGNTLPRAAAHTANFLGGASRTMRNTGELVDAQMRERGRQQAKPLGRAIPPGAERRLDKARKAAGDELADFEKSRPESVPVSGYAGAFDEMRSGARRTEDPTQFKLDLDKRELNFVSSHAADILGMPKDMMAKLILDDPQAAMAVIADAQHSVRDAGELGRSLRQQGRDVFNTREKGTFIPQGEKVNAQGSIALGEQVLEELKRVLGPDSKDWQALVDRYRDLQLMKRGNDAMRAGGATVTGLPALGGTAIRGAAVGGPMATLAALGLIDPQTAMWSSIAAASASPANIFRAGSIGGRTAELAPTAVRATRTGQESRKNEEDRKTRLKRTAGGS